MRSIHGRSYAKIVLMGLGILMVTDYCQCKLPVSNRLMRNKIIPNNFIEQFLFRNFKDPWDHSENASFEIASSLKALRPIATLIASTWMLICHPYLCWGEPFNADRPELSKAQINPPSPDFWYPPYLLGNWKADLSFKDAIFTDTIPLQTLAEKDNVPGFSKYSVFMLPLIGKDISTTIRFVQLDSHPREDRSYNLRNLVGAFTSKSQSDQAQPIDSPTIIESAPFYYHNGLFNLQPFNSAWKIKYHDGTGSGDVTIQALKREISIHPGNVETIEIVHQEHDRIDGKTFKHSKTIGDYAINWRLSVPEAAKDEYIASFDLSKSKQLIGELDLWVYLQPTNDLYFVAPGKPVGKFTYSVNLERVTPLNLNDVEYPFVKSSDDPVELQSYFGY